MSLYLRQIPASEAISVNTLVDSDLAQGERLLLKGRQDQPVICFRLEAVGQGLNLVVTDKMGNPERSRPIDDESARLMIEFSVRAPLGSSSNTRSRVSMPSLNTAL